MHLLPSLKTQEAFEVPVQSGVSTVVKLVLGIVVLSILAGFLLRDWGTGAPQTSVTAPAEIASETVQTALPGTDETTRTSETEAINETTAGRLPVIPEAPSDSMAVEVQQVTAPLVAPDALSSESAKSP